MKNKSPISPPIVLIVLDGWGYREEDEYNAINNAHTPYWDQLWKTYPHTLLEASGLAVGLPDGQMGNSEVGHLHMGLGRLVLQDLTRIDQAIESGKFYENSVLKKTIQTLINTDHSLHIFGLLSPGGVHSHISHIQAMVKMAAQSGLKKIYVHAILDGRDTPPRSAEPALLQMQETYRTCGAGQTATLIGRYYAMDRDKRWDRTERAYKLYTEGNAVASASNPIEGLKTAYARGESDEFVQPTLIHPEGIIKPMDAAVFMNFRSDRARQLTSAFTDPAFPEFSRFNKPALSHFVTLTEYSADIKAEIAFPPASLANNVGECIAQQGYKQLRIAETEKYAHVTFFFNGGKESVQPRETRILVPSPKVTTYDLQPGMSAETLTDKLIEAIQSKQFSAIICNFANPDMVGHTGNLAATVQGIETIDHCLSRVVPAIQAVGGEALITADHGNAECMFDPMTQQPHTAHTTNLVPAIYIGRPAEPTTPKGVLYDIGPTLLYLMGIEKPAEMTGNYLFKIPIH